jgi:uncharacterized repeat protein (TIGR04076 family)
MFKVKATVVGFLGDTKRYPCHFNHKIGDEVIWDGEKFIGRLCGSVWPALIPKVNALWSAGPRYIDPAYYYPFWYASLSVSDPSQKKYDGIGFKSVLKTIVEPPYHLAHLQPPEAFRWPPHPEKTIAKDIMLICPDTRTSMVMKLEAFDLSDKGYDIPYFRRQMAILSKVSQKPGINVNKILNEFSKKQIEEIYPPLSPILIQCLVEELELLGFLKIQNGKTSITKKGQKKLEEFKTSLSATERKALRI